MEYLSYNTLTAPPISTYAPRFLPKTAIVITGGLLVLWVFPPAFLVAYLGLIVYAARGPKESVQAFTILAILLLLNPGMYSKPSFDKSLRWLIFFSAFGRVLFDSAPKPSRVNFPIIFFSFSVLVLSLITSYNTTISALKIVTFGVGTYTLMTCFYRTLHLRAYWASWFLTIGLVVFVCSLPLYGSYLGYFRNGVGFQGILNHPQVYGPVAAALTAWTTCIVLFYNSKQPAVVLCMVLGWIAIYTSQARTSLVMILGGIGISIIIGMMFKQSWRLAINRTFSVVRTLCLLIIATIIAVLYGPQIMTKAQDFLLKGEETVSYEESFQGSRGFLIEQQMINFRNNPIAGIGFGVASDPEALFIKTEGATGIPVGASIEKGFMPSAVLEEMGITGALLVLFLLGALIRPIVQGRDMAAMAVLFACVLVNLGEMVFFSLGGTGLFLWVMIGFAFNQAISSNQFNNAL